MSNGQELNREAIEAALAERLRFAVRDECLPGATASALVGDSEPISVAAGYSDISEHRLMMPHDRMLAASIGKSHVAAVALAQVQSGNLDLDGPISTWLGNRCWFSRLPNGPEITLRMLLNHSSGLEDYVYQPAFTRSRAKWLNTDAFMAHEDKIGLILDRQPLFKPGAGFAYSDTNYILAGFVIEAAAGRPYYSLLQDLFLGPLGLADTIPSDRRALPGLIPGYAANNDPFSAEKRGGEPVMAQGVLQYNPASEWTGGGLATTARDLTIWARALYGGHALRQPYLDEIVRPSLQVPLELPWQAYGLAAMTFRTEVGDLYGHWGAKLGYSGLMAYSPKYQIAIAMLVNTTLFDRAKAQIALFRAMIEAIEKQGVE